MSAPTLERPGTAEPPAAARTPPQKPLQSKKPAEPINPLRRKMIWALMGGYLGINFLMFLRFFFPRALYEPNTVFNIGPPSSFHPGVNQDFLQSNRIWVVIDPGRLFVIFARCTHLGCTPDWLQQQDMFHCPCHGSEYDSDGVNFAGPAPRPMDRCRVTLQANGTVVVDSSRLYMQDPRAGINQSNDPGAFISI